MRSVASHGQMRIEISSAHKQTSKVRFLTPRTGTLIAVEARERVRRALQAAGLPLELELRPAISNANEAWVGENIVVRVNWRGDLGRLEREQAIASLVPKEAKYPGVVSYGRDDEIEWLFTRRVTGTELSRAWPDMSREARANAAQEVAHVLHALHSVDDPALPVDGDVRWPPHVLPLEFLVADIEHEGSRAHVDPRLVRDAVEFVRERWDAFDDAGRGLVHGDPHLENFLWDGEHVTALLDLEWARRSWIQVDLEILLAFCDHPWLFVAEDYEDISRREDYAEFPGWLREAYPQLFDHPRVLDRLVVLSIGRDFTHLPERGYGGPPDPHDFRDRRNHVRLLLEGRSHLHQLPALLER